MDNVTKVWAIEIALIDGSWEIAETDDRLELFAHEGQARDALSEYLNGSDDNEENFRLVCFTRSGGDKP